MNPLLAQLAGLFSAPALAAAGALCVAIPVAIHLLSRQRRKRSDWGAMRFLRLAYKKQRRKLRLERWLLLLARCLIVLLAGLALAGPMLAGWWGVGERDAGRVVHVVLDDGLSTRSVVSDELVRFDRLRGLALEVVAGLKANDRVQVWRGGRPDGAVMDEPTLDHGAVRKWLKDAQPGWGASDVAGVLRSVNEAVETSEASGFGESVVFLLSDFARGDGSLERAMPTELEGLGEKAVVVVSRPEVGSANVQVSGVRPRRSLVLAPGSGGGGMGSESRTSGGGVQVELRRWGDASAVGMAVVRISLVGDGEAVLSVVERPVTWLAGQSTTTVTVELPVPSLMGDENVGSDPGLGRPSALGLGGGEAARSSVLAVRAELVGAALSGNVLEADDVRSAVLEVRERLNVGVMGEGAEQGLGPAAFVRAALSPRETSGGSAVMVQNIAGGVLNRDTLSALDAVVVVRPDVVGAAGWQALAVFVEAGGLLWVFPPADETGAEWFALMRAAMELDWSLDERGVVDGEEGATALDLDRRPPDALVLLSADWKALLGPVRVTRRLALSAEDEQVWVGVSEVRGGRDEEQGNPGLGRPSALGISEGNDVGDGDTDALMVAADVGLGGVVLSGVALDERWTNLATKPLFPALMQDGLRGVLGDAGRLVGRSATIGDRPVLGGRWRGQTALVSGEEEVVLLPAAGGQVIAERAIAKPGVYGGVVKGGNENVEIEDGDPGLRGASALGLSGGEKLAVNVEASAGDVRGVSEAEVGAWLDGLGPWSFTNPDDAAASLVVDERRTNLGWVLLWVLLALVVIEMAMARWFSHAEVGHSATAATLRSGKKKIAERIKASSRAAVFLLMGVGAVSLFGGEAYGLSDEGAMGGFHATEVAWPTLAVSQGVEEWLDRVTGVEGVSWSDPTAALGWRYALPAWAWVLIVITAASVSWWSYRRLIGRARWRVLLAGLRGLLILLVVVLIAGPQLVRTDETVEPDWLLVLVDRSASMSIADMPFQEQDGGEEMLRTRDEALREALMQDGAVFGPDGLGKNRKVAWLGFGEQAYEIEPAIGEAANEVLVEPAAMGTALRSAIDQGLRLAAGRPITGLVVLSDGRSPESMGSGFYSRLEQQSVRVYTVPIGAERLPLDLALVRVDPPTAAFINDPVPVTVVVDQPGAAEGDQRVQPGDVTVRLIDVDTEEVLDEKTLEGVGLGKPLRLEATSSRVGEQRWRVEVEYRGGGDDENSSDISESDPALRRPSTTGVKELNLTNNAERISVTLIDRPIRVLYIEGYPRWEYRYLKNTLLREKSIDSSMYLLSADRAFAQEGDTPITRLPADPEEWRRYDVIIMGDIPAEVLSADQRKQMYNRVAEGGAGLIWIGGPGSVPTSYAGTMLADLMPMRDPEAVGLLATRSTGMMPTALAESLSVLRLNPSLDDDQANPEAAAESGWPAGLPVLRWAQDVGKLKPTAEVLAYFDQPQTSTSESQLAPAVMRLRFGAGQVLYVATDETWRWRYGRGEEYPERFWVQLVRMLGRSAAAKSDERVRLSVSSRRVPRGGTVVVDLDVEDASLLSRDLPTVKVEVRKAGEEDGPVLDLFELRPEQADENSDGSRRRYTTAWQASRGGELVLEVAEPALAGLGLRQTVEVVAPDDELRRAEADRGRLETLATATRGEVVELNNLKRLGEPGVIRNLARKTANDVTEPIWNSALALSLLIGLVSLEWIGRKLVRLV